MMTVTIDVAPKLPSDTGDGNNSKTCAHRESYPAESETRGGLHGTFSSQPSDALLSQTAVTQDLISGITAVDNARTCTRGRQKNEDKSYKSRGFGNGGKSNRQKGSKGLRDGDNSSSNGGNSGADGNGEDNDGSDDDDDDEYLEDEEEEEEEEEDDEEEESKNEEEEAEESGCSSKAEKNSNGVDVGIKKESDNSRQRACRQRTKQEEDSTDGLKDVVSPVNLGFSVPAAELLDKLPNSLSEVEQSLAPAPPGTPVSLHGIICHETMGGVLVLNIKWRNKIYSGSLIDCSRHAWATPRFQTEDEAQCEDKAGGRKGAKGKRQRSTSLTSMGSPNKDAPPLKHKLRGRRRGAGPGNRKGPGHKMLGKKRKSRTADDDSDDNSRHGKRSCTLKTSPSPQPSPTLIACPEPGCDKKYKHINGLRYHQAHAHLEPKSPPEETNQSDDISTGTSPSPVEEFKEPNTKPSGKSRTSRTGLRSQSVSPTGGMSGAYQEKRSDPDGSSALKPKDGPAAAGLLKAKKPKAPVPGEESTADQEDAASEPEPRDAAQCPANQEEADNGESERVSNAAEAVSNEVEEAVLAIATSSVAESRSATAEAVVVNQASKASSSSVADASNASQGSQEVWETVLDSGCSSSISSEGFGFPGHSILEHGEPSTDVHKLFKKDGTLEGGAGSKAGHAGTTVSLSELGIVVEDISENEEEIDPGQDPEPVKKSEFRHIKVESKYDTWTSARAQFPKRFSDNKPEESRPCEAGDKAGTEVDQYSAGNESLSSRELTVSRPSEVQAEAAGADLRTHSKGFQVSTNSRESGRSASRVENEKVKQSGTLLGLAEDKSRNETRASPFKGLSMTSLQAKSISHSAVEPPLTNTDTPSSRYKYFRPRNYGDESYNVNADDLVRTSRDSVALAPIRNPESLNGGGSSVKVENASPLQGCDVKGKQENNSTGADLTKSEKYFEEGGGATSRGDIRQKTIKQERPHRNFLESRHSGSGSTLFTLGSNVTSNSVGGRPEEEAGHFPFTSKNSIHFANRGVRASEPPVIKIEKPRDTSPDGHKSSSAGGRQDSSEQKSAATSRTPGAAEDQKPAVFPRAPPALVQKNARAMAPTLPVGVAHPYPRTSDRGAKGHEAQDHAVTTTTAVVSSVPYVSPSGRIQTVASGDTEVQLPDMALKSKHLKSVRAEKVQEIPVGEVSPVALKRSPGPAMHAGLPPVVSMLTPAIKGQSTALQSAVRGVKSAGFPSEHNKQESRHDHGGKQSDTSSLSGRAAAQAVGSAPKVRDMGSLQPRRTASPATSPDEDAKSEESGVVLVREDAEPKTKPKAGRERMREKDEGSADAAYRSQAEGRSPDELRRLQLQQQLRLQHLYQAAPFVQGGVPLAYLQGLPYEQVMAAPPGHLLPPEELQALHHHHMHAMFLRQQEHEKSSNLDKDHSRGRTVDRPEVPSRPSEDRRDQEGDAPRTQPADQEKAFMYDYRGQYPNENNPQPPVRIKTPTASEPPEKKTRTEQTKSDQYEQSQRYKQQEKFLQNRMLEQKMVMLSKLESEQKQPGGSPSKRQTKDREEGRKASAAQHAKHEPSSKAVPKPSQLSVDTGKSHSDPSQDSPHRPSSASHSPRPAVSHSPRASRSPNPSRHSEGSAAGRAHVSSQFLPNQFQAYLQSQHLQPSGQFFEISSAQAGAHLLYPPPMLQHMQGLPPGYVMRMSTASGSEASVVTSAAPSTRDRRSRSPLPRGRPELMVAEDYAQMARPRSHGDADSQRRLEKLIRLQEGASERPSSATGLTQDRRSPSVPGRQASSARENSSRSGPPEGGAWTPPQSRASIISNNLAVGRRGEPPAHGSSRSSTHTEEEHKRQQPAHVEEGLLRRQRLLTEHAAAGHPGMHGGQGHLRYAQFDSPYGAMTSSQHPAMEHYIAKRQ